MPFTPNDNTQKAYNAISEKYDVGSYDQFVKSIQDPTKLKKVYDALSSSYDMGQFNDFQQKIGFDSKEVKAQYQGAPTQQPSADQQLSEIRQQQQAINTPPADEQIISGSPTTGAPAITDAGLSEQNKKLVQQQQTNYENLITGISKQLNQSPDDVKQVLKDFPNVNNAQALGQLSQLKSENPYAYEHTLNATNWQQPLYNAVSSKDGTAAADNLFDNNIIPFQQDKNKTFQQVRENYQNNVERINQYIDDPAEKQTALTALAKDYANNYNGQIAGTDEAMNLDPKLTYLNKNEKLAQMYLQDTDPAKAAAFQTANVNPAAIANNSNGDKEKIGLSSQQQQLAQIGINLRLNADNETLLNYNNRVKNGEKLTPEEMQDYERTFTDQQSAQNDLDEIHNPNNPRYGLAAQYEIANIAHDLTNTQQHGFFGIQGLNLLKSLASPVNSIYDATRTLFSSDENNKRIANQALGEGVMQNSETYYTNGNKYSLPKTLKSAIDAVNNNSKLSDDQKQNDVIQLLSNNKDWYKIPSEQNSNITAKGIMYGVGNAITGLAGFLNTLAATGGIAESPALGKATSTVASMMMTSYDDEYKNNLANNIANPAATALATSAIQGLAFEGIGGGADAIKKALTGTVAGDVVNKMTDDEILKIADKTPQSYGGLKKGFANSLKTSLEGGLRMQLGTTAGQIGSDIYTGNTKTPTDYLKQAAVQTLEFSPLMAVGAISGRNELNTFQKSKWWDIASNPEDYNTVVDNMVQNGRLSAEKAANVKHQINNASDIYKNTNFVDANGKELSDNDKLDLLAKKLQLANMVEIAKKGNPAAFQQKVETKISALNNDINLISDPQTLDELNSKKSEIESQLNPEPDENGKIKELPEDKKIELQGQLDSINQHIADFGKDKNKTNGTEQTNGLSNEEMGKQPTGQETGQAEGIQGRQQSGQEGGHQGSLENEEVKNDAATGVNAGAASFPKSGTSIEEAGKKSGIKPISDKIVLEKNLRTMDLGEWEGTKEDDEAKSKMKEVVEKRDVKAGKTGETFDEFLSRAIPVAKKALEEDENNTTLVTHSSVLKAFKVWDDMGRPPLEDILKGGKDESEFTKRYNESETHTGDVEKFQGKNGNILIVRHGQTEDNKKNNLRSGNTNLTDDGVNQALKSGKEIKGITNGEIPKIISSDLPRTVHTSNLILDENYKLEGAEKEEKTSTRDIPDDLEEKGQPVNSQIDALRRYNDGDRIFAFDEQTQEPFEITSAEPLMKGVYTEDQLLAYPKESETTSPIKEKESSSKQDKINDLIEDVNKLNKRAKNAKGRSSDVNEIRLRANELGLTYNDRKGKLYNENGKEVKKRSLVTNKTEVPNFNRNDYSDQTNQHINDILSNENYLNGMGIKGEDGRRLSQSQLSSALQSIRDNKVTYGGKAIFDAVEKAVKDGGVEIEDLTTGQHAIVPIKEYFEAFKEPVKPLTDDELSELNTQLGEDAFTKLIDNEINEIYETGNEGENIEPKSTTEKTVNEKPSSSNNTAAIGEKANTEKEQIKTKENAIQEPTTGEVLQRQQSEAGEAGSERERVEQSEQRAEPAKESKSNGEEEEIKRGVHAEISKTLLTHKGLQRIATETGSEEITSREKESRLAQLQQANRDIDTWRRDGTYDKNIKDIISRASQGKIDEVEQKILANHLHELRNERLSLLLNKGKNSKEVADKNEEIAKVLKASEQLRSKAGGLLGDKALASRIPISYGSPDDIIVAKENASHEPIQELPETIKELSAKVNELEETNKKLQDKITDILTKNEGKKVKSAEATAKEIADTIRKAKLSRPDIFSAATPASLIWDSAVELAAKTIELSGKVIDGVNAGIEMIKNSDWYKNLTEGDQKRAEQSFTDWMDNQVGDKLTPAEKNIRRLEKQLEDLKSGIVKQDASKRELTDKEKELQDEIHEEKKKLGLIKSSGEPLTLNDIINKNIELEKKAVQKKQNNYQDLVRRLEGKKDNVFAPKDAADIWRYAQDQYINNDPNYNVTEMINKVAMDLGITADQVKHAMGTTQESKRVSDLMYKNQYEKRKIQRSIQIWINKTKSKPVDRLLGTISAPFRDTATFGHNHALLFTHAGSNLSDPELAKKYFSLSLKQFKIVYGNNMFYEEALDSHQSDPLYLTALRGGCGIDPNIVYDDWELANKVLEKFKIQGHKGFLILKMMRLEVFKNEYKKLSDIEKADPETIKNIAKIANHWTGTAGIKVSAAANALVFAPNLIVSKFARLTTDPMGALYTIARWGKSSVDEKAAARIILKKTGRIAVAYAGALLANNALLSIIGSKNRVNFTQPTKSDFLQFKTGGGADAKAIDPTGGMTKTFGLLLSLAALPFQTKESTKLNYYGAYSEKEALNNISTQFLRSILSPFAGVLEDNLTHVDYSGNVLPWYSDKPGKNKVKLTSFQYVLEKMPIPISDAFSTVHNQMINDGATKMEAKYVLGGIMTAAIASTGIKVGNEPKPNPYIGVSEKFADRPSFKFLQSKNMDLPTVNVNKIKALDKKSDAVKEKYVEDRNEALDKMVNKAMNLYYSGKDVDGNDFKHIQFKNLTPEQLKPIYQKLEGYATEAAKSKIK